MGAGFKSVTDTSVVEALDFEYAPPCEIRHRSLGGRWVQCERAAEWLVTHRMHCVDGVKTRLVCSRGMADYQRYGGVACETCGQAFSMPDRIIRTERIKP